ncbi:MAG TPA: response regulator transcription factor [Candidatus Dormibacteraeota bacterium]|nr:response regulator transcription factor [Candidatus Dormibacteraeota bacterium]
MTANRRRSTERRDLTTRPLCDVVALWFQLHPSALAPLDKSTVRRMASRLVTGTTLTAEGKPRTPPEIVEMGPFRMDRAGRTVHVEGREIQLSPREFDLLALLLSHPGVAHSSAQLTRGIWGTDAEQHRRGLYVYIRRLRGKLEPCAAVPFRIRTLRGRGYRIELAG